MCLHESKKCDRCNEVFECKAGNIAQCQCYPALLTVEERDFIGERFADCLCFICLMRLKQEYIGGKEEPDFK
jgi:hypothetical protein